MTENKADELVERLQRAVVTAQNDDLSEPLSEKRDRHVERQDATRDAIDTITGLRAQQSAMVLVRDDLRAQLAAAEARNAEGDAAFRAMTQQCERYSTKLASARKALAVFLQHVRTDISRKAGDALTELRTALSDPGKKQ